MKISRNIVRSLHQAREAVSADRLIWSMLGKDMDRGTYQNLMHFIRHYVRFFKRNRFLSDDAPIPPYPPLEIGGSGCGRARYMIRPNFSACESQ